MPIYEFYCSDCHRVFNFLSRSVNTERRPACPRCGRPELARRPSLFAISRGRAEPAADAETDLPEGLDEQRLAQAMESLASEAQGLNEEDPRQQARLMRRLFETAGLPVGGGMEEALRRLEAGEDPESVEAELGDALEADPSSRAESTRALAGLRRKLPPSVDPSLYEL